ncbi:hypothetical protein ARSEF1564_009985 [Beauveria bassiana]
MDELIAALVARNIEELFEQCGIKKSGQEQANATIRSLTASIGESSHSAGNIEYCPPPLMLPRLPAAEAKVMESILVDCEKLNRKLHQVSTSKEQTSSWTANTLEIQGYVADIAQRDFTEAAYFWDIITKLANEMDLTKEKNARGPLTDFTEPERQATREFLRSTGVDNLTYNRLSEYRQRWRRLSNMRRAGVDKILCYHTKQFNTFCKHYEGDDL